VQTLVKDIVIIGSGVAGSTCAFLLKQNGYNVVVLEKSEQIGGRIYTKNSGSNTTELGARWVHDVSNTDPKSHLILKLVEMCGIKWNIIRDIVPFKIENKQHNLDITLPYQFARDRHYKNSIFHEAFCSDDNGFPTAYFNEDKNKDPDQLKDKSDYFVKDGYIKLINGLLKNIDVRCNHFVIKCNYQKNKQLYTIICSNKTIFISKYVVITSPPNASLSIKMQPLLPKPICKIFKNMCMCHLQQAVYTFKHRIWDKNGKWWIDPLCSRPSTLIGEKLLFLPYTSQIIYWWWTWKYTPFESETIFNRGALLIQKALSNTNIFENNFLHFEHSDWKESYSCGDDTSNRRKLQMPLNNGKLFLAGEHTSTKRYGFVDGAAESGIRVAELIYKQTHIPD